MVEAQYYSSELRTQFTARINLHPWLITSFFFFSLLNSFVIFILFLIFYLEKHPTMLPPTRWPIRRKFLNFSALSYIFPLWLSLSLSLMCNVMSSYTDSVTVKLILNQLVLLAFCLEEIFCRKASHIILCSLVLTVQIFSLYCSQLFPLSDSPSIMFEGS